MSYRRKELSQNFLISQEVVEKIVEFLDPGENDVIVEVGPGQGILTEMILKRKSKVIAVERDTLLSKHLENLKKKYLNFDFIIGDIRNITLDKIGEKVILFSNLPFSITGDFINYLLRERDKISKAVIVFQKEVVDKICALQGEKEYSGLSVIIQAMFEVEAGFEIPPHFFKPSPEVWAKIVKLKPKSVLQGEEKVFADFVEKVFKGNRKKKIKNIFKKYMGKLSDIDDLFHKLGIDPEERVYKLMPVDYIGLFKALSHKKKEV